MRAWGALMMMIGLGAVAVTPAPAAAAALPPTLGPGGCYDPTQANADYEAYGPTDVNVQAGNGRVTVNENAAGTIRSEEHTSELQSHVNLVCRLLLEKKKKLTP